MKNFRYLVPADAKGQRLDVHLASLDESPSRSQLKKAVDEDRLFVDGETISKSGQILQGGEEIVLEAADAANLHIEPEDIPIPTVYEDEHLVIVSKPPNMPVHPGPGHSTGTLVNALLFRYGNSIEGVGAPGRPGIVHRLDKDTSGLLVVSKTEQAHIGLSEAFAERRMEKIYLAIVFRRPNQEAGRISMPIGRHQKDRKKFAVDPKKGKEALTEWVFLDGGRRVSLLALFLRTGRTHQARVHCAAIGHAICGDPLYASSKPLNNNRNGEVVRAIKHLPGQALHAWRLSFTHPITGEALRFQAAPGRHFMNLVEAAELHWPPAEALLSSPNFGD